MATEARRACCLVVPARVRGTRPRNTESGAHGHPDAKPAVYVRPCCAPSRTCGKVRNKESARRSREQEKKRIAQLEAAVLAAAAASRSLVAARAFACVAEVGSGRPLVQRLLEARGGSFPHFVCLPGLPAARDRMS